MRVGLTIITLLASAAIPRPMQGQEAPSARFHITAETGFSVQDGFQGVRFGRDLVSYGLRATAARWRLHPWIDGARFTRPAFECVSGVACNDSGWLARVGVSAPLGGDSPGEGVGAEARTGVGASFAEDTSLSYLVGLTFLWRGVPRITPGLELRWEHSAGINLTMIGARIGIEL